MVEGHIPTWEKGSSVQKELPKLVSAAHKQGTKVLTSIGGWIGSITFRYIAFMICFLLTYFQKFNGRKHNFQKRIHRLVYWSHEKVK